MPSKVQILQNDTHAEQVRLLGERIRAHRKELGISATAAAEAAGMSRVTWHRIEKGEVSVTIGAWFNALAVLGMDFSVDSNEPESSSSSLEDAVPIRIRLDDFPQLQALAWQVTGTDFLTPREAIDIYERNWRHVEEADLETQERNLIANLRKIFDAGAPSVP